jgi:hypothetical protein
VFEAVPSRISRSVQGPLKFRKPYRKIMATTTADDDGQASVASSSSSRGSNTNNSRHGLHDDDDDDNNNYSNGSNGSAAQEHYTASGSCKKVLYAMCLGLKSEIDVEDGDDDGDGSKRLIYLEVYPWRTVRKGEIKPNLKALVDEVKRRSSLLVQLQPRIAGATLDQHFHQGKIPRANSWSATQCTQWLLHHPITTAADVLFLRHEAHRYRLTITSALPAVAATAGGSRTIRAAALGAAPPPANHSHRPNIQPNPMRLDTNTTNDDNNNNNNAAPTAVVATTTAQANAAGLGGGAAAVATEEDAAPQQQQQVAAAAAGAAEAIIPLAAVAAAEQQDTTGARRTNPTLPPALAGNNRNKNNNMRRRSRSPDHGSSDSDDSSLSSNDRSTRKRTKVGRRKTAAAAALTMAAELIVGAAATDTRSSSDDHRRRCLRHVRRRLDYLRDQCREYRRDAILADGNSTFQAFCAREVEGMTQEMERLQQERQQLEQRRQNRRTET